MIFKRGQRQGIKNPKVCFVKQWKTKSAMQQYCHGGFTSKFTLEDFLNPIHAFKSYRNLMSTGKLEQQIWSYSVHTVFHKSSFRLKTWHFFMVLRGRAKMHVILKIIMCMWVGTKKSESRKHAEILRMLLKPYFWLMFCVKNQEFDFSTQHLQIMLIIFFSQVHGMFKISSLTANLKQKEF